MEGYMKSVLIGILTYNHEKYVAECLQSALGQSYKCDVFVTDDASTDKTVEIIRRYLKDSPNMSYELHSENSGDERRGFHEIIKRAEDYDYVYFFSGDDILYDNSISILVDHAEKTSADWVYGGLDIIDPDGILVDRWTYDGFPESVPDAISYMWIHKSLGTTLGSLFSTKFLKDKKLSRFPNTTFSIDASTAIDWYTSWPNISRIKQQVVKYRWMHDGSRTAHLEHERSQMQKDLTEKMISVFGYNNIVALLHGEE